MKACICVDIVWDTDEDDLDGSSLAEALLDLPTTVAIIVEDDFDVKDTEALADALNEQYGFSVDSFDVETCLPVAFE